MAILRNREVQILGRTDGGDVSPTYNVLYADGNREVVKLSELQLTGDEYNQMVKANGEDNMTNVKKIEDKDLQTLRDGQDKEKIEKAQANHPSNQPVQISKVLVDPSEVTEKASKPVVKK